MKKVAYFIVILFALHACKPDANKPPLLEESHISNVMDEMTKIMVHDVTNPPLAARFFSYACLAGYEVVSQQDSAYRSMYGVLQEFPRIEAPAGITNYSHQLAAILAMVETAKKMQPSGNTLSEYEDKLIELCRKKGFTTEHIENSRQYAQAISKQIMAYAKSDRYSKISNFPRYTPLAQDGAWYPTPPGFFAPVEPYFNTVRSFTLDSAAQFKPILPVAFSADRKSDFYTLMMECYQEGKTLTEEHRQIAAFWDCNPFALQDNGHMMVGMKKISPGAHWMGITGIACHQSKASFEQAMKIHTVLAIGLMDAFISCWDEKFRSNRIRPETAIRKYIDPSWKPLLQTPPFPEYLSGHSTVSSASAVILSHYFGENFSYTDTVEEQYGLQARKFTSFQQAAIEAGLSRFYGGIHFMDAIDQGRDQGLKVGKWVIEKMEKQNGQLTLSED